MPAIDLSDLDLRLDSQSMRLCAAVDALTGVRPVAVSATDATFAVHFDLADMDGLIHALRAADR